MMSRPSLWFCVPAHGRFRLTAICLRQLRRTCRELTAGGVDATAVVVASDENLQTARRLGFATVRRDNSFVSRRFNDGIQLALDPRHNPRPADYVVPCGSDDWVDHRLFFNLPPANTVVGFQHISYVREDGAEISTAFLDYTGGSGIRIYPRELLEPLGYRPAAEDRSRGCDTSILTNVVRAHKGQVRVEHHYLHRYQIVDWKSRKHQLNSYRVLNRHRPTRVGDPFTALAGLYPEEALAEMQAHYNREPVLA